MTELLISSPQATYWYSSIKRYDFMKRASLLHTTVNAGHFTQIVWKNTKYLGVGKSVSKTGKIFVVGEFVLCRRF